MQRDRDRDDGSIAYSLVVFADILKVNGFGVGPWLGWW
jgi:hypothetical protein